jgi:hypothetical protein
VSASCASPLEKEYRYYLEHLPELVEQYDGKVVVIKDERVIGAFESDLTAVAETKKHFAPGTFLVHHVSPDEAQHPQTFHSRVSFKPRQQA